MSGKAPIAVNTDALRAFCARVFVKLDVPPSDAEITADVLVSASLRGVDSHGVARLRRYVQGLQDGLMLAHAQERVITETNATALIDAGGGLGQPVSYRAMQHAIEKAADHGVGLVAVRNSNHYGIAGYYAMMALPHDMIGMSLTNADVSVLPTFGLFPMLGTNPIAVAAPAGQERPFVLDMATSVVAVGKIVMADRHGRQIPEGWATDETGAPTTDPGRVLDNRLHRRGGGALPLGGLGELLGGHKGYGLALMVEILSGILPGAAYADSTYPRTPKGKRLPADLGHFFGAINISAFRELDQFKADMDDLIRRLKRSPKAEGADRIFIHGEKEFEQAERRAAEGIPLDLSIVAEFRAISEELDVGYDM